MSRYCFLSIEAYYIIMATLRTQRIECRTHVEQCSLSHGLFIWKCLTLSMLAACLLYLYKLLSVSKVTQPPILWLRNRVGDCTRVRQGHFRLSQVAMQCSYWNQTGVDNMLEPRLTTSTPSKSVCTYVYLDV